MSALVPAYPTIADVSGPVDLAVIAVPAPEVLAVAALADDLAVVHHRHAAHDGLHRPALEDLVLLGLLARRKRIGPYATAPLDPKQREKAIAAFLRAGHAYALARR